MVRNTKSRARKFLKFSALALLLLLLTGAAYFGWQWQRLARLQHSYPEICYQPKSTTPTVVLHRKPTRTWVPLSQIAPEAVGAIVVSEDWAFFEHPGYDLNQIKESLETNMRKGRYARGASTITQQVVRNLFLNQDKTLRRKLHEFILAVMLEQQLSKRKILEIYLNIAEMGDGIYGIRPAARNYFKKSPSELNAKEGAFLAMLLPSPHRYAVSYRRRELSPFAQRSIETILDKMVQAGYISRERAVGESCLPLPFEETDHVALKPECAPLTMPLNDTSAL